ncbi:MAG TPA: FAD-dependent oxidoreductase [Patescibacteria group bacterium]|nr:FAD-dependent oxidoreductase [Patescibacteria group bacterium]
MKVKEAIVIIGAGPAGLSCAFELTCHKKINSPNAVVILDKNKVVGGLARTYEYKGYRFDVGPHRFYTKNQEVLHIWRKFLKRDLIEVTRLTRMFYKGKLFYYPVQLKDVVLKLGIFESFLTAVSFIKAKLFLRSLRPKTFEDWIRKHFGQKLYQHFFKTYTEKVWGIPCSKIGSEWAAQRIKNLNFIEVIKTAIFGERTRKSKSLINKFYYPKKGAGYCYKKMADYVNKHNVRINLQSQVTKITHTRSQITSVEYNQKGQRLDLPVDYLFSSMPLTQFILSLDPAPDKIVIEAAKKLSYRDHITVNLIIKRAPLFPDHWIYVHSPEVKMARITNYNNFSKEMVKNPRYSAISVEYFAFQEDDIWRMNDQDLISFATGEMFHLKLTEPEDLLDGFVIRETEAYPTYYLGHKPYFDILKNYAEQFTNLQLIGRGGMYRYNNMDHAIYSGLLAARNYLVGYRKYLVWNINEDAEYLEEDKF